MESVIRTELTSGRLTDNVIIDKNSNKNTGNNSSNNIILWISDSFMIAYKFYSKPAIPLVKSIFKYIYIVSVSINIKNTKRPTAISGASLP